MLEIGLAVLVLGAAGGLGFAATRLRRPCATGTLRARGWNAAWLLAQALLAGATVCLASAGLGLAADAIAPSAALAPWMRPEFIALAAMGLLLWFGESETPRSMLLAVAALAAAGSAMLAPALESLGLRLEPSPLTGAVCAGALAPLLLSEANRGRLIARVRTAATVAAGDHVLVVDHDGRVLHGSDAVWRKLNLQATQDAKLQKSLARVVRDGHGRRARFRSKSGKILDAFGTVRRRSGPLARARGILIRDVTTSYRDEKRLTQLANYDSLTGLANRRLFLQTLTRILADDSGAPGVGLLYIDLDGFKSVNDSLGHGAGDRLLEVVSRRLQAGTRPDEVARFGLGSSPLHAARLSGDEFAVVVPGVLDSQSLNGLAEWILESISRPVEIGDRPLTPSASIGIAAAPEDGDDVDTLIRHADMALYCAKTRGRRRYARYEASFDADAERAREVETGLRRALEREELQLYYQPKVDVATGTVTGLEALMRWSSAELGDVGPGEFIPVAERRGLVTELGCWALDRACRQIREWRESGFTVVPVAVNVSSQQFNESDLQAVVSDALKRYEVEPNLLELELTESLLIGQGDHVELVLRDLRSIGVRIALDDFGTGYSALTYLNRFDLDVLKIDRGLLREIDSDPATGGIVSAVVSMSHSLGLKVVAEGVDHEEQVPILKEMGCDQIQGFLYSPAVPPDEVVRYFARGEQAPIVCRALAAGDADDASEVLSEEPLDEAPAAGSGEDDGASPELLEEFGQVEMGRVLIVDDDERSLGPTALRLGRLGIDVHYASDPDEARLLLAEEVESIRVVASSPDVELAKVGSLMDQLASTHGERGRLLVIGDRPDEERRAAMREAGVDWVLWTPVNDAELRCLVRSAMSSRDRNSERREPRVPVDLVATISVGPRREVVVVSSLSPRGAFIETNDPLPVGRSVRIELPIPNDQFRGFARVVHSQAADPSRPTLQSGMGVSFFGVDRDAERLLRKAVKELESRYLP